MSKINLAVIFGSPSGEHEVSLSSAKAVIDALDREKYNVIPVAITKKGNWLIGEKGEEYMLLHADAAGKEGAVSVESSQSLVTIPESEKGLMNYAEGDTGTGKIDLVLPILHGPYGEDGKLQGMLDMLGIPYVFSGVLAHAIGMNKPKAKIIAASAGVRVAKDLVLGREGYEIREVVDAIGLPVVVKPSELGSSVGISIAKNEEDLRKGIEDAFKYGNEVLLEEYIKGRELTVTVMGNENPKVLAITEIIPLISEFYDYKAKYEEGGSKHICPAEIPDDLKAKVEDYAVKTFRAIGCADLARIDFIWDEKSAEFYFIDINTIPGMTGTSLAPEAAKLAGMEFPEFLDKLIQGALKRKTK